MVEVSEAKEKIFSEAETLGVTSLPIDVCNGYVCASDIVSPYDHPFFNNAAVDGYAIYLTEETNLNKNFSVIGEIRAGKIYHNELKANEALRIFTGAAFPECCNTIIMQEYANRKNDMVFFQKNQVKLGNHIRKRAEQIKQDDVAFSSGDLLNPNTIAFLASLGVESTSVFRKPIVKSIVTGDELLPRETFLLPGHIYESNGLMLTVLLDQMRIKNSYQHCKDNPEVISKMINVSLKNADVLLLSGGVSVGDYDFTRQCVEKNGFEIIVHWVNQKPGKPLLFARRGEKYIFGLPGNPRAALVCFYQYVYPFLKKLSGYNIESLPLFYLPAYDNYTRKQDGKSFFINVHVEKGHVKILKKQQSHMLQSFVLANALVELSPVQIEIKKGDLLKTYFLPYV